MNKNLKIAMITGSFLALLLAGTANGMENSGPDSSCISCHQETYEKTMAQSSIHAPFIENNCAVCHVEDQTRPQANPFHNVSHQPGQASEQAGTVKAAHGDQQITIDRTVSLCLSCHRNYQRSSSHPVNIRPRRPMIIPADYPTTKDGKVTCLSCHFAHGSNLNAMLRKSAEAELCIGCHSDKANTLPPVRYAAARQWGSNY